MESKKQTGTVSVKRSGKTYHGTYVVEHGMVTVTGPWGRPGSTQVSGMAENIETLAAMCLGNIVDDHIREVD